MEGGGISGSSRRPHSSKAPAPPPPPKKVMKCDPAGLKITERDIPKTLSALHRKELLKQSREHAKEPQAVMFRKLEDGGEHGKNNQTKAQSSEERRPSFAHSGETLLARFYGMLYTNDSSGKEWILEADGFIPICFIQAHGNANKPFRIIAVEGSKRIMEYHVNVNTTCARSETFVKWQDGSAMFGAYFGKEDQAEQFVSTVSRMVSNVNSFAQLMKKPERKEVIRKMSDPASSSSIHHTKVSLLIKLPDKQTTIMSAPGLLTMNELFDMICDKEYLNRNEHQLSLPGLDTRKVTFDSTTAVGSLKIREVSILRSVAAENIMETRDDIIEDLLDMEGEENKILKIHIPTGVKSFRVPLVLTMRQLAMRICSREGLNPRHHSLQYIDFKHEFLDMTCTVDEIGVGEIRLMDKREHRKSTGVELEPDTSPVASRTDTGTKHHSASSLQKSVSVGELQEENQVKSSSLQDGQKAPEKEEPSVANGAVPLSTRRNSSDDGVKRKPPIPPLPYCVKSGHASRNASDDLHGRDFRDHDLSPIKKNRGLYASSPDLSSASSESGEWPVSRNFKTSTPEAKSKRRAAPPPPPRPARSKLAFYEHDSTKKEGEKKGEESRLLAASVSSAGVAPVLNVAAANSQPKPSQKRRPAPPRPSRPPPPQLTPRRDTRQRSVEAKDTDAPEVLQLEGGNPAPHEQERKSSTPSLSLDLRKGNAEIDEDSGAIVWRGLPIFIAPPPPDELPPPLDECETPVGPLTELEADFLLEESVESTPVAINGVKIEEVPGKLKFRSDDNAFVYTEKPAEAVRVVLPAVQRTQPQGKLESKDDVFPVLPPPTLYSEFSKASLESADNVDKTDEHPFNKEPTIPLPLLDDAREENNHAAVNIILPPILETKGNETTVDNEERDHDSGFDQSPEYVVLTQPEDPMESVPAVISAIPPPADFETRPISPPADFANPTLPPPAEFVTSSNYEHEKPRKKLNVSDSLFPWMHEPHAPLNAVVPLAVPKPEEDNLESERTPLPLIDKGQLNGGHSITVEPDNVQYLVSSSAHLEEKGTVACDIHEDLSDEDFVKRYIESPQKTESEVKVILDPAGKATHLELHSTETVTDLPRLSTEQDKEMISVQEVKTSILEETDGGKTRQEKQLVSPKPTKEANPIQPIGEAEVLLEMQETTDIFIQEDHQGKEPNEPNIPVTPFSLPRKPEVEVTPSEHNIVTADALASKVLEKKKEVKERPEAETNRKPVRLVTESENSGKCDIFSKKQISLEREVPTEESTKKHVEKPFEPAKSIVSEKPDVRHSSQNAAMVKPGAKELMSSTVEQNNVQMEEPQNPWATADTTRENNIESVVKTRVLEGAPQAWKSIVLETLVTPETKPISYTKDPLKNLQARLTELDNDHVASSSHSCDCQNTAVVTLNVDEAVEKKKEFAVVEDVIVPETKQVEFASLDRLGKQLCHLGEDYKSTNKAAALDDAKQSPQPENNHPPTEGAGELSTLSGSPESAGPRPPSSSPPAVSPVSTCLPSPPSTPKNDVQDNEPSKSGMPVLEAERSSPLDSVVLNDSSSPKPASVKKVEGTSNVAKILPSTDQPKQENANAIERLPTMLQRPLILPTDLYHKTGVLESEKSSKQSFEFSPPVLLDVMSASSAASPILVTARDPEDFPRPPPLTVPPLRRHSDLAADLNFVSSAAKVAEKGAETKKELPLKPPNLAQKGNSLTAAERPRSWVAPESESKRRSLAWSSAFRPVSFGEKGMKAVRPVEFAVKPVPLPSTTTPTVSTLTDANVVTANDVKANQAEQMTPSNFEIMSVASSLPGKKNIATPPVSVLAKSDESSNRSSRSVTSTVVQTSGDPKADHTEAPVKKYEIIFSKKPATQENSVDQKEKFGSKVETFGKGQVPSIISQSKYSVFSGAANASSRDFQSVSVRSETKREDKPMKERPQSVIVHGTKFQILSGKEEPITTKENKNVRGEVELTKTPGQAPNIDKRSVPWETASDHSKSDSRQSTTKTQQPPKALNQAPPALVTRPKTANDPTKRLSLPTYIIEQADSQPSTKKVGNVEGRLTFVREQADTETAVVPQGVVAAMRALREKNEAAKGN